MKTMTNFFGQYIYNGKKFKYVGFIIRSNRTENYLDKEEVEDGTWYNDKSGTGAFITWFVPKKAIEAVRQNRFNSEQLYHMKRGFVKRKNAQKLKK